MLRKITIGCAVVVAVLAAPVMSAHSMMGGMGGHVRLWRDAQRWWYAKLRRHA